MANSVTPHRIPVRKLAWATDLHLVFVPRGPLRAFCETLAQTSSDAIAITGDISDGRHLEDHLSLIAGRVEKPIFVLLGNHDRYHTSFADAEEQVRRIAGKHPHVHRLMGGEIFELSARTALIGVDGWADGRSGSGPASPVVLNDTILIHDLSILSRPAAWEKMTEMSRAFAETIKPTLDAAMSSFREVMLLTHVPPLREATWHEGEVSGPDFLPHFCNALLGEVIRSACATHPGSKLTVLCGHTHSEGVHHENNLTVFTAGAIYGAPRIDRVISIPG
ncbi:MAG: metallophosphoesterase [Chthoniobacteraceae bacterium]